MWERYSQNIFCAAAFKLTKDSCWSHTEVGSSRCKRRPVIRSPAHKLSTATTLWCRSWAIHERLNLWLNSSRSFPASTSGYNSTSLISSVGWYHNDFYVQYSATIVRCSLPSESNWSPRGVQKYGHGYHLHSWKVFSSCLLRFLRYALVFYFVICRCVHSEYCMAVPDCHTAKCDCQAGPPYGIRSKRPKVVAPQSRRAPSWVDAPQCVESMRPILFSVIIRDWEAVYHTTVVAPQLILNYCVKVQTVMAWYIVIMTTYDTTREQSLGMECYTRFLISLKERGNERASLTFSRNV